MFSFLKKYADVFYLIIFIAGLAGAFVYLVKTDESAWQQFSIEHNCKAVEQTESQTKYKCDDNYEVTRAKP